ncbi:MAG TPA: hypothetical protein VFG10_00845 [Saprospiraceae bacterium]|nr:hypothetical protein [Saprospiraceae bacterium]
MKDQNPFKQKLYNHTIPVREEMWKHIESTLPPKKRRLPFLWLSLAGFLLLGAGTVGLSLMHSKTQEKNSLPEIQNIKNDTEAGNVIASETNTQEVNSAKASENIVSPKHNKNTAKHKSISGNTTVNLSQDVNTQSLAFTDASAGFRNQIDINEIPTLGITSLPQDFESPDMSSIKPDPSCYKFRGKNGGSALSFDVFAGPGFAPRTFEDTEGGTSPYAEARETTEKGQYAWGAGARINLNLQQGFAVRLGILYEQIGDKFDYTDANATKSTTQIDSFWAADGTFLRADTNRVLIFGTLIKQIHNRYNHIDIPLLLSYELPMGRSTLMLNAGPVLNLTSSQRGQILDSTLNPVHITPGEPDELKAYKNNLGLSFYLGAGALFPLTDNISALVEPRFLYRINPVTLDTYPLKEHRSFAGLNLGIRYHFN